mmetsp:Transcript_19875/g.42806  ORF Transcript_19875/g.42806 Transcript_19875/m.42806 type:complete len:109 (+) Transcript_19875:225-551(+)|eukprot:CAMPEP_0168827042 /NCGR_PEP_ID=MMETSP0726-20121227/12475_1 /TAXON_ID=265536 /ORGANISM="Amphiprora sp., Strain CCMP467" /LENGTH=108 /DNA_ID=CAMNT_0008880201 /DNA_START=161 /DNA_END=487 /DNA_ORIENTATION=-
MVVSLVVQRVCRVVPSVEEGQACGFRSMAKNQDASKMKNSVDLFWEGAVLLKKPSRSGFWSKSSLPLSGKKGKGANIDVPYDMWHFDPHLNEKRVAPKQAHLSKSYTR